MTDNEIIKALKCCKDSHCHGSKCPLWLETTNTKHCITKLSGFALDLINRQKEEVEMLESEIDKHYKQAEMDLLGNMADGGTSCHWCIEKHRAEVIKEFADRLEKASYITEYIPSSTGDTIKIRHITMNQVRSIMKEMVGDSDV